MTLSEINRGRCADVCTRQLASAMMRTFSVTVRTPDQHLTFSAIGTTSADVHAAQLERFGGICSVSVISSREKTHEK